MPIEQITITVLRCTCTRCGGVWVTKGEKIPGVCAKCGTPLWNNERVRKQKKEKRK